MATKTKVQQQRPSAGRPNNPRKGKMKARPKIMKRSYEVEVTWPNLPNRWVVLVPARTAEKYKDLGSGGGWCNCGSRRFANANIRRGAQRLVFYEAKRRFPRRKHPEARLVIMQGVFDKDGMPFPPN
jgi:hypothetical protein